MGGPIRPVKIAVIDYQSGNLRSVARALETSGVSPRITGDPAEIEHADAVVLPGVGSGPAAMEALRLRGLEEPLKRHVASGKPFLGVCLGLQLLLDYTEEGDASCLGIIPGAVRKLPPTLKVPHMGWNSVEIRKDHRVLAGIPRGSYFYFVHSYYAAPDDPESIAGVTEYSVPFCSVYARGNLVATQFHPEKSGAVGLRVYRNFVDLVSEYRAVRVGRGGP
jgi:glutamine amidotransferase